MPYSPSDLQQSRLQPWPDPGIGLGASPVSDPCPLPVEQGCRIAPYRTFRVARLEALLSLQPGAENRRQALDQLGHELAAEITWVDPRNACLSLAVGPSAMAVQVLLELRGPDQLGLMVNSREGMGSGAPLSHAVLEQLLELLMRLLPGAALAYRSDRDGPIRQESGQRNQT